MWDLIDWHGKANIKKDILICDNDASLYFRNIFQSNKTNHHPTITVVADIRNEYGTFQ